MAALPFPAGRARFRAWRRRRPFVGAVLTILSGLALFFSGQLDLGNIHVHLGVEGFQATIIPAIMVLLGALELVTPAQRLFYGVLSLVLAVYSLIGVNLGGFFIGMLLGAAGGVLVVAWRAAPASSAVTAVSTVEPTKSVDVVEEAEGAPFASSRS